MVALHGLVVQFETNFGIVALQFLEEDRLKENAPSAAAVAPGGWIVVGSGSSPSIGIEHAALASPNAGKLIKGMRTSFSSSQLSSFACNPPVTSGELIYDKANL